jgi:hypothetical protein
MRREREVQYEHTVKAWTVGDLRRALDGIPDEVALVIETAETPGSDFPGPGQVIIGGEWLPDWVPPNIAAGERQGHYDDNARTTFQLATDFPSGTYSRLVDGDGDGA